VNTTRTMTRSTAELVAAALRSGDRPDRRHERVVELPDVEDLEGRVLGLILALEAAGVRVRPYPRRRALGLDGEAKVVEAALEAVDIQGP
jgi:hypothetical protein